MTAWLTINPATGKFTPRTVKIQGAVLVVAGLIILGLLLYGALTVGTPVDATGAMMLRGIFVWLVLLGLMICIVGVQQTLTGTRKKPFLIVLGVMFALTFVGAWTLYET